MNTDQDNAWKDTNLAFAIELGDKFTAIFSDSETLSRMAVLYTECRVKYAPKISFVETPSGSMVEIKSILIYETTEQLAFEHDAMENLKGHPTTVWAWKFQEYENSGGWAYQRITSGHPDAPLLSLNLGEEYTMLFGQELDMLNALGVYDSLGKKPTEESWVDTVTLAAFTIPENDADMAMEAISKTGQRIVSVTWVPALGD